MVYYEAALGLRVAKEYALQPLVYTMGVSTERARYVHKHFATKRVDMFNEVKERDKLLFEGLDRCWEISAETLVRQAFVDIAEHLEGSSPESSRYT